jgi:hypothetical protein
MELRFKRKLSTNHQGTRYFSVPSALAKAWACDYVELIVDNDMVRLVPIKS